MTGDDLVSLERIGDQLARIADALDSLAAQHGAPKLIAEPPPMYCPSVEQIGDGMSIRCELRTGHAGHHVNYSANRRWPA